MQQEDRLYLNGHLYINEDLDHQDLYMNYHVEYGHVIALHLKFGMTLACTNSFDNTLEI